MHTSYFIEWIPSWWTLRFFPVFCHYKQCCRERLCRCPFELKCVAILLSIRVILTYIQPALYKGPIPQLHSPTESHKILDRSSHSEGADFVFGGGSSIHPQLLWDERILKDLGCWEEKESHSDEDPLQMGRPHMVVAENLWCRVRQTWVRALQAV